MKKPAAAIVFTIVFASLTPAFAGAQSLSDEQVALAFRAASVAKRVDDFSICLSRWANLTLRDPGFLVCIQGPTMRIAQQAFTAKREYRTFSIQDVKPEDRLIRWTIIASPLAPARVGSTVQVTPPATEILMQPAKQATAAVVRAANVVAVPASWSNALGARFEGQGVIGTFEPATLPSGDLDVIVLTSGPEHRYQLNAKQRAQIQ